MKSADSATVSHQGFAMRKTSSAQSRSSAIAGAAHAADYKRPFYKAPPRFAAPPC